MKRNKDELYDAGSEEPIELEVQNERWKDKFRLPSIANNTNAATIEAFNEKLSNLLRLYLFKNINWAELKNAEANNKGIKKAEKEFALAKKEVKESVKDLKSFLTDFGMSDKTAQHYLDNLSYEQDDSVKADFVAEQKEYQNKKNILKDAEEALYQAEQAVKKGIKIGDGVTLVYLSSKKVEAKSKLDYRRDVLNNLRAKYDIKVFKKSRIEAPLTTTTQTTQTSMQVPNVSAPLIPKTTIPTMAQPQPINVEPAASVQQPVLFSRALTLTTRSPSPKEAAQALFNQNETLSPIQSNLTLEEDAALFSSTTPYWDVTRDEILNYDTDLRSNNLELTDALFDLPNNLSDIPTLGIADSDDIDPRPGDSRKLK